MASLRHSLTIAVQLLCVLFRPADSQSLNAQGSAETGTPAFDVVTLALYPSCVTPWSIQRLNAFFPVRTIHIITKTPDNCANFSNLAPNIECHLEDDLIPGLSYASVRSHLQVRFADPSDKATAAGRSGWYLQQLLKLGSIYALPSLTSYFMIWDLDMIPLKPFPIFQRPDSAAAELSPPLFSTRLDISAVRIPEYERSYTALFGRPARYPRDGMSFVAHWAMVYRPFLLEMLEELGGRTAGGGGGGAAHQLGEGLTAPSLSWAAAILDSVQPGFRNIYYGFSEYTTYVSWVLDNKPGAAHVMPRKAWMRVAPRTHKWLQELRYDKCCPDERVLRVAAERRWVYLGWELGGAHSPECKRELGSDGEGTLRRRR
jgi:hypothetical protein